MTTPEFDRNRFDQRYRPARINVLFVAEAPGTTEKHFYLGNTNLYRTVYAAFKDVFGPFASTEAFLYFFASLGCYLDHLSWQPIDTSSKRQRQHDRHLAIDSLSQRLRSYQPASLLLLMKAIEKPVQQAINQSGVTSIRHQRTTAYPAGSEVNRQVCLRDIKFAITHWLDDTD
ncbi:MULTISPECIES: hypothetical protein [Spirosoma]|uniref:Uracil-DNA glycosylase-like domain-containing protein n=1 Tax=Spirosoma linguale (strain ATCC 33905 / DSM 74 / LMG 10896 / Claus 1) TaxID=504472 RepID=D2QVQ0_SPILD|nr:hypothetical protein [Spirosoma sp.]ADB42882.1 hypothetical protein Slin_6937 [Spirosoma linguale DSM 74]MCX6213885.1 hypothetical protein [Spirosoma sp.]